MNTESSDAVETAPCILCAFNLGEAADEVVKSAVMLSLEQKEPLMILCSYRLIQSNATEEVQTVKKRFESMAMKKIKSFSSTPHGVKPSFRTEIGFLSDRVESFVKSGKVKMLVISHETATTIYEHKGLTVMEFIKKVNVPVLVVPD